MRAFTWDNGPLVLPCLLLSLPASFPERKKKTGREKGKEKEGRDGYGKCGKGCPALTAAGSPRKRESVPTKSVPGEGKLKTAGSNKSMNQMPTECPSFFC